MSQKRNKSLVRKMRFSNNFSIGEAFLSLNYAFAKSRKMPVTLKIFLNKLKPFLAIVATHDAEVLRDSLK